MLRTIFKISKMDCPAEEQMIRAKLEGMTDIQNLKFDIPGRQLEICHANGYEDFAAALESLHLGTKLISSETIESTDIKDDHRQQTRVLWQVLTINFFFFALEIISGFMAGSMGLVADGLDMLADSIVYGLSLIAVGGTVRRKKKIAEAAGYFQTVLALLGFVEVIRRFLGYGETPDFHVMIFISFLALAGNVSCLYVLQKSKSREAHMQASMIFTSMDVIANLGVIVAGGFVYVTGSKLPDLIVGAIVFILVGRGAYRILQLSK
ncbi:MAG: zinc transporter ZitB [Syntrophorhabdus sp. PtaU1.Bin153]|nr:MAG: zinc transporter ZitB [Syntrophorhabdus sp. PtaU1.Bin153]